MEPTAQPSDTTVATLRRTQPWLRFIGIMMLVGAGLMALGGACMFLLGVATPHDSERNAVTMMIMGLAYMPFALLYIYPGLMLLKAARHIRKLPERGAEELVATLEAQRRFWKYVGICLIVILGLYLMIFVCSVLWFALAVARNA